MVHGQSSRFSRTYRNGAALGTRSAPDLVAGEPQTTEARARAHAGRNGVSLSLRGPRALSLSPGSSLRSSRERPGESRGLRARGVHQRSLWRQFQLAWPCLVSAELSPRRIAPEISPLLRRRFQNRMSSALRQGIGPLGSLGGNIPPPGAYFPSRQRWPPPSRWNNRMFSERSTLEGLGFVSRVFSWRQWHRPRREPSDWMDWPCRQAPGAERCIA